MDGEGQQSNLHPADKKAQDDVVLAKAYAVKVRQ
jgi:hypothetical protein